MISLFPHQQEALQETKDFDNIAVYHDMGLGKTFTGSEMMKRFGCKVNLIVCQKSKVQDWVEHFTDNYQMQVFDLTNKKQLGEYHGLSQGQRFFIVGVINYELAWRRKELLDLYDFTLMLDESSLIQNQKAKQTKFILKMKPAHVILLSGTPVGGKYENLWTQVHLLGWKISEDLYNRQYVNWTTIDSGGFQHKIVDKEDPYKNIDRLKSKMREHGAIFKKTEECYELPEQVFTHIRLKAPKEYWKFQKDCIVTIEGQELVGDTSLTKLLYSRQICSQFNQNKLDAFRDLVESTQERLIVFYSFNDELWNITKKSGDKITAIKPNIADKVANKIAGMVDIVARVVVEDDETRTLNFKSNEVIFGGGRLKNIKTTSNITNASDDEITEYFRYLQNQERLRAGELLNSIPDTELEKYLNQIEKKEILLSKLAFQNKRKQFDRVFYSIVGLIDGQIGFGVTDKEVMKFLDSCKDLNDDTIKSVNYLIETLNEIADDESIPVNYISCNARAMKFLLLLIVLRLVDFKTDCKNKLKALDAINEKLSAFSSAKADSVMKAFSGYSGTVIEEYRLLALISKGGHSFKRVKNRMEILAYYINNFDNREQSSGIILVEETDE